MQNRKSMRVWLHYILYWTMKIILNSETIKNIYKHVKILLFAIFVNKLVHFAIFENNYIRKLRKFIHSRTKKIKDSIKARLESFSLKHIITDALRRFCVCWGPLQLNFVRLLPWFRNVTSYWDFGKGALRLSFRASWIRDGTVFCYAFC